MVFKRSWDFASPNKMATTRDLEEVSGDDFLAEVDADPASLFRLQQDARLSTTIATGVAEGVAITAHAPLAVPTPDGNPSAGHPDVLTFDTPWNGYRYWMAFTPYPAEAREKPNIVASHDGVRWEVPAGLTNPIAPLSEAVALGHDYWSDTDLVMLNDTTMAVYFRGAKTNANDGVYRKTSTDGVTWSATTQVLSGAFATILSPAIVREDDGTFTMWCIDHTKATGNRVWRRTSPDGLTWSAASACTYQTPAVGTAWHIDVIRAGGKYHMLLASRDAAWRLYYGKSSDGIAWTTSVAMPQTGLDFDSHGHYRSTFAAVPGSPLRFDVWFSGINSPDGNAGVFTTATWRLGLMRNIDLTANTGKPTSDETLWAFAPAIEPFFGSSARADVNQTPTVKMTASTAADSVTTIFPPIPEHWTTFAVDAIFAGSTTGAGDVRYTSRWRYIGVDSLGLGTEQLGTFTIPTGANPDPVFVTLHAALTRPTGIPQPLRISFGRLGSNAADTLAADLHIVAMRLRKLT